MAYYRDASGKNDIESDRFADVFAEFDFICIDGDCDFFCPECRNMMKCSAYVEFKDEWDSFYT